MNAVFYFFAAVLIFFSYRSFRGGIDYLNFFKKELAKPKSEYTPFVSIIVPCRGLDENLEANLSALFWQNYPAYEILFVVDSENDRSAAVIRQIIREPERPEKSSVENENHRSSNIDSRLIVAGTAENESQKVHNLREAVLKVSARSEAYVFVDSDARPAVEWLRALVAPLKNKDIGCATGYRWFISETFSLASEMRSAWNASIASALGANTKSNFCWGGSLSIRRELFEKIEMRERWRGVLSDDFAVTQAMKEFDLPVFFVPRALTASIENCSWRELFEFTTRQMKITRVYAAPLWISSFVGSGLFNLVWIWGLFILIFNSPASFAFWFAAASLTLNIFFSAGKSWLRLKAVRLVLTDHELPLRRQQLTQNTLWLFSPAIFFYNSFRALVSRRIIWRGIRYELKSASETLILTESTTKK